MNKIVSRLNKIAKNKMNRKAYDDEDETYEFYELDDVAQEKAYRLCRGEAVDSLLCGDENFFDSLTPEEVEKYIRFEINSWGAVFDEDGRWVY